MGFKARIAFSLLLITAAFFYKKFNDLAKPIDCPEFDVKKYWGPGDASKYVEKTQQTPSPIKVDSRIIENLRQKLNVSLDLHDPLEGINFEYGFNSKTLQSVVNYWRDEYLAKWDDRLKYINTFPHFTTQIQGLQIHYIYTRVDEATRKGRKTYPLLLLHGWPGSVMEFYKLIPKLGLKSDDKDIVFEVVVPSLPGYGWSQAASKPGLGADEMAVVLRNLMLRLGYNQFFIQGGDWGSIIGSHIATFFPENVLGYHTNICAAFSPLSQIKRFITGLCPSHFMEKEHIDFIYPALEKFQYNLQESGYMHLQATKPDTIGAALTNNPVGLVAYIMEKFSTWTHRKYISEVDGALFTDHFDMDEVLDNIMVYYVTNSITTSMRLYSETFNKRHMGKHLDRVITNVPYGCSRFKQDLMHSTEWELEVKYKNIVETTWHPNGGHFAAFELPDVLYKDFMQFVKKTVAKSTKQ